MEEDFLKLKIWRGRIKYTYKKATAPARFMRSIRPF